MRSLSKGFTLVEVIFSLLILAIGVLGIIQGQSGATRVTLRSEMMAQALGLAEQKMTEIEIELRTKDFLGLKDEETGEFKDEALKGFKWTRKLTRVDTGCFLPKALSQQSEEGAPNPAAAFMGLVEKVFESSVRKIWVSVEWTEGGKKRNVELAQLYVNFRAVPN